MGRIEPCSRNFVSLRGRLPSPRPLSEPTVGIEPTPAVYETAALTTELSRHKGRGALPLSYIGVKGGAKYLYDSARTYFIKNS